MHLLQARSLELQKKRTGLQNKYTVYLTKTRKHIENFFFLSFFKLSFGSRFLDFFH